MANSSNPTVSDEVSPGPPTAAMLTELRRRWQQGECISVEDLSLDFNAATLDSEAVLDLIYQEVLLREQLGERPAVDEYVRRFPHLADELRMQFELDSAMQAIQPLLVSAGGGSKDSLDGNEAGSTNEFALSVKRKYNV